MFEDDDLQHSRCARDRSPKSEIGFEFSDVSDAVRQVDVQPSGRDGQNAGGYDPRGNKHRQLVHRTMRRRYVACFPFDHDRFFRTRQNRVEITESLIESVLRRPFDCPPFGFEKRHELISNRQDAVPFAAPFSALRMDSERTATDRPFAFLHCVVNLLPGFLPVSRSRICSATLQGDDIDNLQGSSL